MAGLQPAEPDPNACRTVMLWAGAFAMAVGALPGAAAFVPTVHTDITTEAAQAAGWPNGAVDALVAAVLAPDAEEMEWEPRPDAPARLDLRPSYLAAHHCDRVHPSTDAEAWANAMGAIAQERHAARVAPTAEKLTRHAGVALHAVQDCFSHSDFPDLGPAGKQAYIAAIVHGQPAPPVRLAAVQEGIDQPGMPDDPMPHDAFAKDSHDGNLHAQEMVEGRARFDWSRDGAIEATSAVLSSLLQEARPEAVEGLDGLAPSLPSRWPIPSSSPVAWMVALVAVGAAWRRL